MDEHGDNDGWNGSVYCDESALDKPLHWKKPRRIFVCSMSDLFHPQVPFEFIDKVFAAMALCPQHTFQVLTKRPDRLAGWANLPNQSLVITEAARKIAKGRGPKLMNDAAVICWPLPNLHLGVSCENRKRADERIPILLQIPAAKKFVSFEPLLGEIELQEIRCGHCGCSVDMCYEAESSYCKSRPLHIDYIIIGSESINGAAGRECKLEWVESLVEQAKASGVPCAVKQIHVNGKLLKYDKKNKAWPDAWPENIRVWEI